jgi:hypothetical protein
MLHETHQYTAQGLGSFGFKASILIFHAYNHILYRQWHITEFYSRICQHHIVYTVQSFILIAAIVYF